MRKKLAIGLTICCFNIYAQEVKITPELPSGSNLEVVQPVQPEDELRKSIISFQGLVSCIIVTSSTIDQNKISGILSDSKRALDLIFLKKVIVNYINTLPSEIMDSEWATNKQQYILKTNKVETFTLLNNVYMDLEKSILPQYKRKDWQVKEKQVWIKNLLN